MAAQIRGAQSRRRIAPVPMLATLGKPPSGQQWATQWKFDGQRGLVVVDDDVTVFSRNGADVTRTFPEIAARITKAVGDRRLVLDGEIVALDEQGRPSFRRLQQRWPQQRRPSAELVRRVPLKYYVFDVLAADGVPVTDLTYLERRDLLEAVLADAPTVPIVPHFLTSEVTASDMLSVAAQHFMEGVVVKRCDSLYRGGRSVAWVKCPVRASADVVIVGWWPATGPGATGSVGGLLLAGHNEKGQLVAVGQVSVGFSARERRRLFDLLIGDERTTTPLAVDGERWTGVRWTTPKLVGEVAYREYSPRSGLRHASWKGLRDLDAGEVSVPPPPFEAGV